MPIGVRCNWTSKLDLKLSAAIFSLDGSKSVENSLTTELPSGDVLDDDLHGHHRNGQGDVKLNLTGLTPPKCPVLRKRYVKCVKLGEELAQRLNAQGGKAILDEIKAHRT